MTNEEKTWRQQFVAGLRELADFYEQHECVPEFVSILNGFVDTAEQLVAARRALGARKKELHGISDELIGFTRSFGPLNLTIIAKREEVCQRVKVGEKIIPARPERTLPAEPEKREPVYEWECPGLLEAAR